MSSDKNSTIHLDEKCMLCGSSDVRMAISVFDDRYCNECKEFYCKDCVRFKNAVKILKRLLKFEAVRLIYDVKVFVNMEEEEHDYAEWWDAQRPNNVTTLECEHCFEEFDSAGERREHEHTCTGF